MTERTTADAETDTATRRIQNSIERRAIAALAVATTIVLVALFYYPVATVFLESVYVQGVVTLSVFLEVVRDPFYFGGFARILNGESALTVARDTLLGGRPSSIFGFTTYQAVLSTLLSVVLGVPAAYLLARYEFRGRRTLRALTILPFVLPSIMVAIGFVATFGQNGTFNSALAAVGLGPVSLVPSLEVILLAHAFYNAPLVARVTTAAWESVDASAIETARSLGASPFRAFRGLTDQRNHLVFMDIKRDTVDRVYRIWVREQTEEAATVRTVLEVHLDIFERDDAFSTWVTHQSSPSIPAIENGISSAASSQWKHFAWWSESTM